MDSREQVLTHEAGVKVPIDLQNMSVAVKGWIRVIQEEPTDPLNQPVSAVRAVRADVSPEVRLGPQLDGAWMPRTVALVVITQTDSKILP